MVTFSIPGDGDAAEAGRSTPRPRPALPFAKRAYVPSPGAPKRFGTPQSVPTRKHLLSRDALPASSLNRSQIASNRNIFRQSSIATSPPTAPFSPSLPQSTMTKVFAPGATPEPSRVYRESTAQATPRGMASRATDKELFKMRIEDPDPELSGEVLTNKVPKEWNSKGSIYADQFLKHLCPPDFDDEQRRQFFCILDLRRLKYAANDIFSRKDWKLNVINFAKEFEKSRSIILLRYGLYEFQNIKPSKDVLKRWRREHGLPEPEEEEAEPTPTKKSISKKRKADEDDLPKASGLASNKNKRRAADRDEEEEAPVPALGPSKNKRKASVSDETETQPSKLQKSTSSNSLSLFEKIVNKSSTPAGSPLKNFTKPMEESTTPKPNPFAASTKSSAPSLSRSVFLKPAAAQAGSNIFGYLSDASSAKNSAADTDGEGTDSDAEESEEPSAVASAAETASQVDSNAAFGAQAAAANAVGGESSAPGTRESTPGRSLFDRVTKDSAGQPVRLEEKSEEDVPEEPAAKPVDQTWNPSSTPLKFAPTTSAPKTTSLFGNATSAPSSNIFGSKPSTSSNLFGAKQDKPAEKESSVDTTVELKDKSGSESDKENDEAPKKNLFETKAPALQTNTSALNPLKPSAEAPKATEPTNLFGAPKPEDKPAEVKTNGKPAEPAKSLFGTSSAPPSTNLFGSVSKPAESAPVLQSSTLFGGKPAEAPKATSSLFGGSSTPASGAATPVTSTNLFGAKPATTATSNLFGNSSSTPAAKPLFGAASSDAPAAKSLFGAASSDTPKTNATSAASTSFTFGSNGTAQASKPIFAAPKSPSSSTPMFDGSPMKQDAPSPAKRAFNGSTSATASAAPIFNLGSTSSTSAAPIFGGLSSAPINGTPSFGAGSASNNASGSANFSFSSTGSSFNNPFASGNNAGSAGAGSNSNSGGMFNFGGSSAPSSATAFQFGGGSGTSAPTFGANSTSTPSFGGASGSGSTPSFTFGGSSQPATSAPTFGTQTAPNMFNLQPPAGGASTGTNTPFSLGGGSSLATTPAGGTPEPSTSAVTTTKAAAEDEGEKHEQINLTEGQEKDEEILHDVRAKVLKFVSASEKSEKDDKKKKSPWTTQGVGPLRLLKHKETGAVRLLMRAEPRGNVALNRSLLPNMEYKADEKYVKLTTSNETGDGLETWMVQVKTKDLAKGLAEALEKHKELNKEKK